MRKVIDYMGVVDFVLCRRKPQNLTPSVSDSSSGSGHSPPSSNLHSNGSPVGSSSSSSLSSLSTSAIHNNKTSASSSGGGGGGGGLVGVVVCEKRERGEKRPSQQVFSDPSQSTHHHSSVPDSRNAQQQMAPARSSSSLKVRPSPPSHHQQQLQQQLPASPSPMVVADGSSNFTGFGQPQQLQLQIKQLRQQQYPQQASPRGGGMVIGGRAGTPQSPHPLLSPVYHMGMTGPLRPTMNPQQQQQVHPQRITPQVHPQQSLSQGGYGNSLKKETIVKIVDTYRQFVTESSLTQDKIALIQHLAK